MAPRNEYADYLAELLAEFGQVTFRRMFGGHGVFRDGVMFGLVADDTLYFKCDAQSEPTYQAANLEQFNYPKGDRLVAMSYYQAPEDALEDPDELRRWAGIAFESALRARR